MSSILLVLLVFVISIIPIIIAVYFFETQKGFQGFSLVVLPLSFAGGLVSVALAGGVQLLLQIPLAAQAVAGAPALAIINTIKLQTLYRIFIEIALTEEGAKLLIASILARLLRRLILKAPLARTSGANNFRTFALFSGFMFSAMETVFFSLGNVQTGLLRAISASPLHGACSLRAANAVVSLRRKRTGRAIFDFLTAILLHGLYNLLNERGGISAILAVGLALSALISGIQSFESEE
jgi:RsiW-degrading membrane proteinase PrsW (M82 family)